MSLKNWSTTAASNNSAAPNGAPEGWALSDINNTMRQVMADVRTLAASNTIASAATCDLGSLDETFLTVSGTTTITALGTVSAGIYKFVTFSGALTLTHNGTSLILPGAANITTVAGDTALFLSLGSGNWKCVFYQESSRATYQPLDSDLTAIAALTTTAFGRGMLTYADAATAFAALKQAASDTATGVVELATTAEAITGTDTTRAVTCAGVTAAIGAAIPARTWTDVSASRVSGTVYHNTATHEISEAVGVSGATSSLTFLVGPANPPTIQFYSSGGGYVNGLNVQIPAGWYYKATVTGSVNYWNELA